MEKEIKERLKAYIRSKGMSVRAFEESIGRSNGYINNSPLAMPKAIESIIQFYPDLNVGWLMTGDGEMNKRETTALDHPSSIPIVNMFALGGALSEQIDGDTALSLDRVFSPVQGAQMAIEVSGDSMEPEYPSGSRLFCRRIPEKTFLEWGKVYVVDTTAGAIVKQLQPGSDSTSIACFSINEKRYKPFEIKYSVIRSIWKILGVFILK